MSVPGTTPWAVVKSPTDAEMYAVQGLYLVADCLPIEDAYQIAASPALYDALSDIMEWITNWDPNFVEAEEWPTSRDAARAALALARGVKA